MIKVSYEGFVLTFRKINCVQATLFDFVKRGLIVSKKRWPLVHDWETTDLGRAVCIKFYGVDESNIKICKECGQQLE